MQEHYWSSPFYLILRLNAETQTTNKQ